MERIDTGQFDRKIKALIDDIMEKRLSLDPGLSKRYDQLLKFAEEKKDVRALGMAYYFLAEYDYDKAGRSGKYETYLSQAITCQQEVLDYVMLTHSYNFLGMDVSFHGHPELAFDYYRKAEGYASQLDDRLDLQALVAYNMGLVFLHMADYEEAISYFMNAITKIEKEKQDSPYYNRLRVMSRIKEGMAHIKKNELTEASRCMEELRAIERDMPDDQQFEYYQAPVFWIFEMTLTHAKKDMEQCNILIPQFIHSIRQKPVKTEAVGDVLDVLFNMLDGDFDDFVGETMEIMKPRIESTNILNFRMIYSRLAVYYYRKKKEDERALEAAAEFFDIAEQHRRESEKAYAYFIKLQAELDKARLENERLEKKAITDELTQISNRFHFNEVSEKMFKDAAKKRINLGVEILDVDNFKRYNDGFGHQVGDLCLQTLAKVLDGVMKEDPEHIFVARYGGDEFVAVYIGMSDDEVMDMAKLIRERVVSSQIETGDENEPFTTISISQGIRNCIPPDGSRLWDYMFTADHALYNIKQKTKGEICLLNEIPDIEK
ncbi:MAG: GGDEF domain-containing protein [Eubacterium sp.]|nr:GGDEF domain-containing protein [Eubacterium sp.]